MSYTCMMHSGMLIGTNWTQTENHMPLHGLGEHQEALERTHGQLPPTDFASFQSPSGTLPSDGPSATVTGLDKEFHPKRSEAGRGEAELGPGANLLQAIDRNDDLRKQRSDSGNTYYPFASRAEWELGRWLGTRSLPQSEINEFLHLDWVSSNFNYFLLQYNDECYPSLR